RVAEFSHLAYLDLAAQLLGHRLHAVTDAQHGNAQAEYRFRRARRAALPYRVRTAGKDHALRAEVAHEGIRDVVRMDLAVDLCLAHAARNQLRVLRAKVEDQDFFVPCGRLCGSGGNGSAGLGLAHRSSAVTRLGSWALPW